MSDDALCDSIYSHVTALLTADRDMRRANRAFAALPRANCAQVGNVMVTGFSGVTVARLGHIREILADTYPRVDVQLNGSVLEVSVPIGDEEARLADPRAPWLGWAARLSFALIIIALLAHMYMPDVSAVLLRHVKVQLSHYGVFAPVAVKAAAATAAKYK